MPGGNTQGKERLHETGKMVGFVRKNQQQGRKRHFAGREENVETLTGEEIEPCS